MNEKEKLVVANFKMNLTANHELKEWFENFEIAWRKMKDNKVYAVLCPQLLYLKSFIDKLKEDNLIKFGSQNCFWEKSGAFTGEISPFSLNSLGAKYVILGHSERRKYFGENDERINLRARMALKAGLSPVFCIGETLEEKDSEKTIEVIKRQLENCLKEITDFQMSNVVICYEPVWAISSNKSGRMPDADEVIQAKIIIKKFLTEKYNRTLAGNARIIYGGSVNGDNVKDICLEAGMNGALVGSASLKPYEFVRIIEQFN